MSLGESPSGQSFSKKNKDPSSDQSHLKHTLQESCSNSHVNCRLSGKRVFYGIQESLEERKLSCLRDFSSLPAWRFNFSASSNCHLIFFLSHLWRENNSSLLGVCFWWKLWLRTEMTLRCQSLGFSGIQSNGSSNSVYTSSGVSNVPLLKPTGMAHGLTPWTDFAKTAALCHVCVPRCTECWGFLDWWGNRLSTTADLAKKDPYKSLQMKTKYNLLIIKFHRN